MNIVFIILSLLDIATGVLILRNTFNPFIKYMMYFSFAKGGWSIFSSIATGHYFDWMGIIDVIAGMGLFMIYNGASFYILSTLGTLVVIKGIYSFILSSI